MPAFPRNPRLLFAHAAYRLGEEYSRRGAAFSFQEVRSREALAEALPDADVLVVSGFWRDDLMARAPNLRFLQSISAGTDQYGKDLFRARGVRLASARGANANAVAEHAIALLLAVSRRLGEARDNQARGLWRGMIADPQAREDELAGKTLVVVGLGAIGARLARLASAFDMNVVGVKRDVSAPVPGVARLVTPDRLHAALAEADMVALCCPLSPDTEGLMNAAAFAAMKPSAALINVARGKVVDEAALIAALQAGRIAAAGLDCTMEEPLPPSSPLWAMPNVFLTPHTGGETSRYEARIIDLLLENLGRLMRGETALVNEIV